MVRYLVGLSKKGKVFRVVSAEDPRSVMFQKQKPCPRTKHFHGFSLVYIKYCLTLSALSTGYAGSTVVNIYFFFYFRLFTLTHLCYRAKCG